MSLFDAFKIAGTGIAAQGQRLNSVASNLANADSAAPVGGEAYRAKHVVFESAPLEGTHGAGVKVREVKEDTTPGRKVHDPKHPFADAEGYVTMPNVDPVEEMVNMISASRTYQMNAEVANTAKALLLKTLSLGS
jgi:flagellar basal-body rod protein FlgC